MKYKPRLCIISSAIVIMLTGCATSTLEHKLSQDRLKIQSFSASSATVTLHEPTDKYERFRVRLEQAMKERYVHTGSKSGLGEIKYFIDVVHFDHKGASFATGGASGGNWVEGRLIILTEGSSLERKINAKFNTGGGFTIIEDWEDRMIKALLVNMDFCLLEIKEQK